MIGLHGKMGSGKDTVLERLQVIAGSEWYERVSFADPLKRSAAALLGISVENMERLKRDDSWVLGFNNHRIQYAVDTVPSMTMRVFLQRYGTEAHREIFGDNFWVEQGMRRAQEIRAASNLRATPVFTDVRFENEARAIIDVGGEIWHVQGPDEDTGDHASEAPLPVPMIDRWIDNTVRDDAFSGLDEQLRNIVEDLSVGSRHEDTHGDDSSSGGSTGRLGFLG